VVVEGGSSHGHGALPALEVPEGTPGPTVDLVVHKDAKAGWNLELRTTDFRWAPENVSTDAVMGEGHAHLYVDGVKVARVYGPWYYLGSLPEGEHQLRVTMNANDHSEYAVGGHVVEDDEAVVVPTGEGGHGPMTVTVNATAGAGPGTYVARHAFADAGDYVVEVHVSGDGFEETAYSFEVEVLAGDPAALTVAGIVLYITLAVGAIAAVQCALGRRRTRRLRAVGSPHGGGGGE
jgi:hypothetical protein